MPSLRFSPAFVLGTSALLVSAAQPALACLNAMEGESPAPAVDNVLSLLLPGAFLVLALVGSVLFVLKMHAGSKGPGSPA